MTDSANKKKPVNPRLNSYRSTEVMTANREAILLMLYDGAVRFLKQAIEATERNDLTEKARLIGRTQEIINELRATLNFEVGQEIATSLEALYQFITDRLIAGNQNSDTKVMREGLNVLCTLQEAWQQAVASLKK